MSGLFAGRSLGRSPTAVPCTDMVGHLFLTGEKGVGKSTLLAALLAGDSRSLGGFFTRKSEDVFPGRVSLHLLRTGRGEKPSESNFLFFCDEPPDSGCISRFERLGRAALEESTGAEVLVMDELGPRESGAAGFQGAVLAALDGETPVLGVLQKTAVPVPFLERIAARNDVTVVEVTKENRDALSVRLRRFLQP